MLLELEFSSPDPSEKVFGIAEAIQIAFNRGSNGLHQRLGTPCLPRTWTSVSIRRGR